MIELTWMDAPIWTAAGRTMAHMLWLGLAVGFFGAVLRRILRSHSPELRHNVALALLVSLGLAPAVIGPLVYEPGWTMPTGMPPGPSGGTTSNPLHVFTTPRSAVPLPAMPQDVPIVASRQIWIDRVLRLLPIAWALGTSATLVLLSAGWIGVERLRRSSLVIDSGPIPGLCRRLSASIGLTIHVGVAVCDRLASPVLIGLVRPLILLPPAALSGWTPEELELVLWHELTHLRRHDHVWIVLQRGVEAFLFFQPAVWWLSSWLRLERELCCDRVVVSRTGRPRAYAEFLARLAGIPRPPLSLAFVDRSLSTRIARILNLEPPSRRTPRMRPTLPEGLGTLALVISLAAIPLYATACAQTPAKTPDPARMQDHLRKLVSQIKLDGSPPGSDWQRVSTIQELANLQIRAKDRDGALATLRRAEVFIRSRGATDQDAEIASIMQDVADLFGKAGDRRSGVECLKWYVEKLTPFGAAQLAEQQAKRSSTESVKPENQARTHRAAAESYLKIFAAGIAFEWADQDFCLGWLQDGFALISDTPMLMRPELLLIAAVGFERLGKRDMLLRCKAELDRVATTATDPGTLAEAGLYRVLISELAGDREGSTRLLLALNAREQENAIRKMVASHFSAAPEDLFSVDVPRIKIGTGGEIYKVDHPELARRNLSRVIQLVETSTMDGLARTRILAKVAELRARAGDLPGAVATANALPDRLVRKEFPKVRFGFCDALKPIALSAIAVHQSKAGELDGARASLSRAKSLTAAIVTADEKVVGTLAVARGLMDSGLRDEAEAYLGEVAGFLDSQPEPRRSRALLMMAEVHLKLGDHADAARWIERTREQRSIERATGYTSLAEDAKTRGDAVAAREWTRKYVAYCEAQAKLPAEPAPKAPSSAEMAETIQQVVFEADTYISPDANLGVAFVPMWDAMAVAARDLVDDTAAVLTAISKLPVPKRRRAMSMMYSRRVAAGDFDGALRLFSGAKDPNDPHAELALIQSGLRKVIR